MKCLAKKVDSNFKPTDNVQTTLRNFLSDFNDDEVGQINKLNKRKQTLEKDLSLVKMALFQGTRTFGGNEAFEASAEHQVPPSLNCRGRPTPAQGARNLPLLWFLSTSQELFHSEVLTTD